MTQETLEQALDSVFDPEIPVLTIRDLGILRHATVENNDTARVTITPTYSGCPAMSMLEVNIKAALQDAGFREIIIETVLSPAWTTDWLSEDGREKLKAFGIAPPATPVMDKQALTGGPTRALTCPHCGSQHTEMLAQFASTACKALFRCMDCREPFDYFKCH